MKDRPDLRFDGGIRDMIEYFQITLFQCTKKIDCTKSLFQRPCPERPRTAPGRRCSLPLVVGPGNARACPLAHAKTVGRVYPSPSPSGLAPPQIKGSPLSHVVCNDIVRVCPPRGCLGRRLVLHRHNQKTVSRVHPSPSSTELAPPRIEGAPFFPAVGHYNQRHPPVRISIFVWPASYDVTGYWIMHFPWKVSN
ncbi:hypothetical protein KSP40_PGU011989 [Platanthera guangdongensis]|uniref:Uncharacterized protein n=1 Tax=Platanthera guangdongensis TaxID=2320717 RepID=A0ABR2M4P4_9ASPA